MGRATRAICGNYLVVCACLLKAISSVRCDTFIQWDSLQPDYVVTVLTKDPVQEVEALIHTLILGCYWDPYLGIPQWYFSLGCWYRWPKFNHRMMSRACQQLHKKHHWAAHLITAATPLNFLSSVVEKTSHKLSTLLWVSRVVLVGVFLFIQSGNDCVKLSKF